jgi:hypothetical protein
MLATVFGAHYKSNCEHGVLDRCIIADYINLDHTINPVLLL